MSCATKTERILQALADGPGTSGDVAAETGLPQKLCAGFLRDLWTRGKIARSPSPVRTGPARGAYFYSLLPGHP